MASLWSCWLVVATFLPIVEDQKYVDARNVFGERLASDSPSLTDMVYLRSDTYVGFYSKLRQLERLLGTKDLGASELTMSRSSASSRTTNNGNVLAWDYTTIKSKLDAISLETSTHESLTSESDSIGVIAKKSGPRRQHKDDTPTDIYRQYRKCRRLPLISAKPVLVIASCPPDYVNETARYFCNHIPIYQMSYSHETNVTRMPVADDQWNVFNNIFCAECHGVTETSGWKFIFNCDSRSVENLDQPISIPQLLHSLDSADCKSRAIPPYQLTLQPCSDGEFRKELRRQRKKRNREKDPDSLEPLSLPVSFSILMNFGIDGKAHILFGATHHIIETRLDDSCPDGQIFDPRRRKCRLIVCEKGYVLKSSKCVEAEPQASSSVPNIDESIDIDEVAQVFLEVNVSIGDYFLLFSRNFRREMVSEISHLLNMSESRIQNFSVEHLNGTGSGQAIQIQKLVHRRKKIIPQSPIEVHVGVEESTKLDKDYWKTEHAFPTTDSIIEHEMDDYRLFSDYKDDWFKAIVGTFPNDYRARDDESYAPSNTVAISDSIEAEGASSSSTVTTDSNIATATLENMKNKAHRVNNEETVVVKISFLLLPPSSKTKEESSVDKAVQQMTDLVDDNRFKVKVNNTRISVVHVLSDGEPLTMTSWCDQGVVNLYNDKEFRIGQSLNPKTNRNETAIIVNELGDLYWPGEYDLMVYFAGDLSFHKYPSVSGYVFVCNLPRIVDKVCSRMSLSLDEYEILDRDRVIVDIYTKAEKSIYEYEITGNNTVEICMPKLADKSCGRIELSSLEFTFLENKSIKYLGEIYNMFQYENISNGTVEICIPKNYFGEQLIANSSDTFTGCNALQYRKFLSAEVYLTAVLSMVSIVSMAAVILTYCLFASLRNLPGVNTINLTLALFVAEMIFEFGSNSGIKEICVAVGISLHFFFLVAFFWMNVMAYDVFRTFANSCVLTRVRSKKKYIPRYSLYAWGCPALIVAACVFIDLSGYFRTIRIGYGARVSTDYEETAIPEHAINFSDVTNASSLHEYSQPSQQRLGCWIQEPMASLAAFGGPIFLILLANVIFYIKAIAMISATTRSSMKNTRRSSRVHQRISGQGDVIIYVRMSTVMGFTWIIGFTSAFISSVASEGGSVICLVLRILTILFTLLNCSQGFLIFFVFVANKRVANLYKDMCRRKWKNLQLLLARQTRRRSPDMTQPDILCHT